MTLRHRIIALSLLAALTLPMAGVMLWLKVEQYQTRKEVKHMLMEHVDRAELVRLSFSHEQVSQALRWKHSKEFEYDGVMYDIVSQAQQGDSMTYWCWKDDKETKLERQLDQLTEAMLNNSPDRQKQQDGWQHFLKNLYASALPNFAFNPESARSSYGRFIEEVFPSRSIPTPSPPPDDHSSFVS